MTTCSTIGCMRTATVPVTVRCVRGDPEEWCYTLCRSFCPKHGDSFQAIERAERLIVGEVENAFHPTGGTGDVSKVKEAFKMLHKLRHDGGPKS
jgi:hypothetical protein